MAKKKSKKAKAAKKSKPAKSKKAKSNKKKKAPAKKKAAAKKKPAKKKVVKKKAAPKRKAVKKKSAPKKKVAPKKAAPKKKVQPKVHKPKVAPKKEDKVPFPKPEVHKEHTETKTETPAVQQQEVHSGEHQESFVPHATHLKAGDHAPYFAGVDQHGHTVSINDFAGKTLVLYFYPKDDTDGCTAESCSLRDEYSYITSQNHAVVGVSADDVESHKKFADKFSLPFPLIADTNMDIIHAYDVWGRKRLFDHIYDGIVRTTFIIKDGIIQRVITSVNTKEHGKQVMEA